jgi:hypothetical protein
MKLLRTKQYDPLIWAYLVITDSDIINVAPIGGMNCAGVDDLADVKSISSKLYNDYLDSLELYEVIVEGFETLEELKYMVPELFL